MAATLKTLLQRFTFWAAAAALVALLGLGLVAGRGATGTLQRLADQRGTDVASRATLLVGNYVRERHVEAEQLAANPYLIKAALGGTNDPDLATYLRHYPERSEFTTLVLKNLRDSIVIASGRVDRSPPAEDPLWQQALKEGAAESDPVVDSASNSVSLRYAVAVRPSEGARPVGVLEGTYQLDRVGWLLTNMDLGDSAYLQLVDRHGKLLYGPPRAELRSVARDTALYDPDHPARAVLPTAHGPELIVSVPAARGRFPANEAYYWVLFREPTAIAYGTARLVWRYVWLGAVVMFAAAVVAMLWLGRWLNRRVAAPVRTAGGIAARVASGDLTVAGAQGGTVAQEVGELLGSVGTMVAALRRLVGAIRSAADDAAAMAAEISASTEEMSASTEEMTATTQELSRRAGEQSQLVRGAAGDATKITEIATMLAAGAEESVRRNSELAGLSRSHKEQLDSSTAKLADLAAEVDKGAQEADALAKAAAEIQKFVAQTKAIATQTNMLALNAAIEAARAGQQGRGFAVVADEVRKLASQAAAAAGDTADTVRSVLGRVQATRDRLVRLAQTGAQARGAAEAASQGLLTLANQAEANDAWGKEIAGAANETKGLVQEIAGRLETLAKGTDELLASAEQIAASSEEQSASTEEIAASANRLAQAADQLTGAVQTFRLKAEEQPAPIKEAAD